MPHVDPEARRKYRNEYMRRRYLTDPAHRERHLGRIRKNDEVYRAAVVASIAAFRAGGCLLCPEDTEQCLTAHHLDSESKEFNIGDALRRKLSPKRVVLELSKCVCLCQNCHAKVHAGLVSLLKT